MSILQQYPQNKVFAFLTTALRSAGDAIAKARKHDLCVQRKKDNTLVSAADLASNTVLQEMLRSHYPHDQIISEEQEHHPKLQQTDTVLWVLDPLDGTSNFINGYPFYCISVALMQVLHNGELASIAGGIFAPNSDKLYLAYRDGGAFCNDTPITAAADRDFADCFLVTDLGANADVGICKEIYAKVNSVRIDGASALDLALVAAGVYDGLWQTGLKLWDIAAGYLLVTEAGGTVCHMHDTSVFDPARGDIVAGNNATVMQLLTMTKK